MDDFERIMAEAFPEGEPELDPVDGMDDHHVFHLLESLAQAIYQLHATDWMQDPLVAKTAKLGELLDNPLAVIVEAGQTYSSSADFQWGHDLVKELIDVFGDFLRECELWHITLMVHWTNHGWVPFDFEVDDEEDDDEPANV